MTAMASGTSIGMMDPAYFVGRRQILEWINSTFQMSLSKIEQTASGECFRHSSVSVACRYRHSPEIHPFTPDPCLVCAQVPSHARLWTWFTLVSAAAAFTGCPFSDGVACGG